MIRATATQVNRSTTPGNAIRGRNVGLRRPPVSASITTGCITRVAHGDIMSARLRRDRPITAGG
jgi:hypothetical protein